MTWLALLIPILPGIFWLWAFYQTDRLEPEPIRLILATFGLGALATVPAWLLEQGAELAFAGMDPSQAANAGGHPAYVAIFLSCFLVIGPAEELCKFLAVRLHVFRNPEFDEPLDGIVYAAAAALGFASLENVLYVIDFRHGRGVQWGTLLLRSVMALPGHVIFAATWGYALGRRRFDARYPVAALLCAAAGLHGLYDFVLMVPGLQPLCLAFMAVMVPVMAWQIRALRRDSPFRTGGARSAEAAPIMPRAAPRPDGVAAGLLTACPRCAVLSRWEDHYCAACGAGLDKRVSYCGRCRHPVPQASARLCATCGTPIWPA